MPPFFKTIRTKTLLSVIIPFAVVLVLVAVIGTIMFEYNTQEAVKQRDTDLASISAARLSEGLARYAAILQQTGTGDDIRSMDPVRAQEALSQAAAAGRFTIFDGGVTLYDSHGNPVAAVPAPDTGIPGMFPDPVVLSRVNATLRPSYSNVVQDEESGKDMFLIAVPIQDRSGNMAGVLAGSCSLDYSLIGSLFVDVLEIKPGGSGYAYLVDGNGRSIYHRYMPGIDPSFEELEPVQRVIAGETGAVLTQDTPGGDLVVSAYAPVPGTGWGVITHEDWETVFGPRRNYNSWILFFIIAGGGISGALVFIQVTRILGPVGDLTRGAQRIGSGDFTPMEVPESGDEIQSLVTQFNNMAGALKESFDERDQAGEDLRTANARLRRFVDANIVGVVIARANGEIIETNDYYLDLIGYTREEFEQGNVDWRAITPPEWLPLDDHAIAELRERGICTPYEKEYVRRDGTRVTVYLSDALLPGPEEQIVAFVINITEHRKAEKALRKSEAEYRSLFENMLEGLACCRMIYDTEGRPQDFIFLTVNPAFNRITGTTDVTGRRATEVFPGIKEAFPEIFEMYGRVASTGKPDVFDLEFTPVGKWLHISVYSPAKDYFVAVFEDISGRKEAEKTLNLKDELLHLAGEMALVGGWEFDVRTLEGTWTDAVAKIHDLDPSQPTNAAFGLSFYTPASRLVIDAAIRDAIERKKPYDIELEIISAKGHRKWIRTIGVPVVENGCVVRLRGVFQDITSRRQAEEEMQRSFERFKTVLDSLDALVYVSDMQTHTLLFINKYGRDIWGDVEGRTCWQAIQTGQSGPCPFCTNDRLVDNDGNPTAVCRWEFKNSVTGKWYDCRDRAIRWLDGRIVRIEIATDITTRKEAEESLRETKGYLENLIRYANAPIIVWDPAFRITEFNHACEVLTGMSRDQVLGKSPDILFPPASREHSMQMILRTAEGELWDIVELPVRHVSGEVRIVLWNSANIRSPEGAIIATIAQGQDITERKKAELQVKEAVRQITFNLEQMAILNDQIRNPLSVIIAAIDLEGGTYAAKILDSAYEINKIITELDSGWIQSEKVHNFLKSHYQFYEEEKEEEDEDMDRGGS